MHVVHVVGRYHIQEIALGLHKAHTPEGRNTSAFWVVPGLSQEQALISTVLRRFLKQPHDMSDASSRDVMSTADISHGLCVSGSRFLGHTLVSLN